MTADMFEAISPGLPSHQDEVMAGYRPQPTIAEQDATHGAGCPPVDHGSNDGYGYGHGGTQGL